NLLGERPGDDPELTLTGLNRLLEVQAITLKVELKVLQTNHEGELIDALHRERRWADAVIINPGALAHTSYALRDAIAAVERPTFEVHLSDMKRREIWRRKSVLKEVCAGQVTGKGPGSYLIAMEKLLSVRGAQPRPSKPHRVRPVKTMEPPSP